MGILGVPETAGQVGVVVAVAVVAAAAAAAVAVAVAVAGMSVVGSGCWTDAWTGWIVW